MDLSRHIMIIFRKYKCFKVDSLKVFSDFVQLCYILLCIYYTDIKFIRVNFQFFIIERSCGWLTKIEY